MGSGKHAIIATLFVGFLFAGCRCPPPDSDLADTGGSSKATTLFTETRILHSSVAGRDYTIYIALPVSYANNPDQAYPVVYLLDADLWFAAVTEPTRLLHWEIGLPELMIVGIGYGTSWEDVGEFMRLRTIDLTPTSMEENPGSGGAKTFLTFIQDELFPYINSNFRVNPEDRTIAGLSDGALFCLYTLFNAPETFGRYIAVSPHLSWDERVIFQIENDYAEHNDSLSAKLFLAVGGLDRAFASDLLEFHKQVEGRNLNGLEMTAVVLEQETHLTVFPPAFSRALRKLFRQLWSCSFRVPQIATKGATTTTDRYDRYQADAGDAVERV